MFSRIATVIVALVLITALPGPSYGDDRTIHIRHDPGGDVGLYQVKAAVAKELKLNVVIDGVCASACTLLIGLPNSQVCVTGRARLHFHRARLARPMKAGHALVKKVNAEIFDSYPAGIRNWITKRGGLTDRMLKMRPAEVATFFQPCVSEPLIS